jgi:prepilin-type N-terminal cleavage/methylation domain-containing protein
VPRPDRRTSGFTLIEMMIVVAIMAIIGALAAVSMSRARPRATLAGATVDLQALLHGARQQALTSGQDVAVMFFTGYSPESDVVGRVIVYQDGDNTLFDAASDDRFDKYDPAVLKYAARSEIVTTLDLPATVRFGPAEGMGATAVLAAPWGSVPVNLDCTFCDGKDKDRRGAVVFDSRGRARFYTQAGAPLAVSGGSISLQIPALGAQVRTLAVGATTGAVRSFNNG